MVHEKTDFAPLAWVAGRDLVTHVWLSAPLFREPVEHPLGGREDAAFLIGAVIGEADSTSILWALARKNSFAISVTAPRGVKCSPVSPCSPR